MVGAIMSDTPTIQEKLADLCNELNTQDNRITAHPLFIVEVEKRIYGMDSSLVDDMEWIWVYSQDSEYQFEPDEIFDEIRRDCEDRDEHEILNLWDEEIDPEEWGYEQWFYVTEMEFKCAHLTERAADLYIAQNSHNLRKPRVYVTSQHRCYEWNMVRDHLMVKSDTMTFERAELLVLLESLGGYYEHLDRNSTHPVDEALDPMKKKVDDLYGLLRDHIKL